MQYSPSRPVRREFLVFGSPAVTQREIDAVTEVMRSCWIGTGPRVAAFEEQFRRYTGARHALALNSCTAALHLSMLAAGVGPGDEVITTPMTFCATVNAILHTGATPVFVDVDPATQNIDVSQIETAVTGRTRAILPVHFAGRPCDMDAITRIAARRKLLVIEDAAHAIEAAYHGRKIGTIGDMTCFSFYVTKNLFTGEGGMVTCADDATAARIKTYGLHGMTKDAWARYSDEGFRHYQVVLPGYKYNMMDIQAAMGLVQMPDIEKNLERRKQIWRAYDDAFRELPLSTPAPEEPDTVHARHLYTVLLSLPDLKCTRDAFMDALTRENIGSGVHYVSVHLHPYYRERFGFAPDRFPRAADISQRTLSLPLSPKLGDGDVEDVIHAVTNVADCFAK
ncbi:MAG: aminotransferase class I/II-fold pyridoxal phosphate-dependent enzyme [Chitinivibrionales bacterium]|nr:aminotransferase class I/II-fold pyridoxal phosphate-dependent enzyme [Chitinivibrionales bacterium]MBD3394210.1 aminotransferase class I/II-fold pyridoxal phosphate-dependent enzyme [Chitinivibrionales bacterium]